LRTASPSEDQSARDTHAASALIALLRDPHPVMRAAACFGLSYLRAVDGVPERLREIESQDASAEVRTIAALARNAV